MNRLVATIFVLILCSAAAFARPTPYFATRNEQLVLSTLRGLYDLQARYYRTVGEGSFGNAAELRDAGLIDEALASGVKYGYTFNFIRTTPGDSWQHFAVAATPVSYGKTGRRSFWFDATNRILGADKQGAPANAHDALVEKCGPAFLMLENERAIIDFIRQELVSAETSFSSKTGFFAQTIGQMCTADMNLLRPEACDGVYRNYIISPTSSQNDLSRYSFVVHPLTMNVDVRTFYIDETGVLRGTYCPDLGYCAAGNLDKQVE